MFIGWKLQCLPVNIAIVLLARWLGVYVLCSSPLKLSRISRHCIAALCFTGGTTYVSLINTIIFGTWKNYRRPYMNMLSKISKVSVFINCTNYYKFKFFQFKISFNTTRQKCLLKLRTYS